MVLQIHMVLLMDNDIHMEFIRFDSCLRLNELYDVHIQELFQLDVSFGRSYDACFLEDATKGKDQPRTSRKAGVIP